MARFHVDVLPGNVAAAKQTIVAARGVVGETQVDPEGTYVRIFFDFSGALYARLFSSGILKLALGGDVWGSPVDQPAPAKRGSGNLTADGHWEVLAESVHVEGLGWKHSCGDWLMNGPVTLSNRSGLIPCAGDNTAREENVPYCPACERVPSGGTFGDAGILITSI